MEYQTPTVTDYGTLAELTEGQHDGEETDRAFPAHTPKRDLTFS